MTRVVSVSRGWSCSRTGTVVLMTPSTRQSAYWESCAGGRGREEGLGKGGPCGSWGVCTATMSVCVAVVLPNGWLGLTQRRTSCIDSCSCCTWVIQPRFKSGNSQDYSYSLQKTEITRIGQVPKCSGFKVSIISW